MNSLWMLVAAFLFSIMGVCVKLASDSYTTAEIVFFRGLVGVLMLLAVVSTNRLQLATQLPWEHTKRGFIGVSALWLWFFAFGELPVATAATLNNMAPIWLAGIIFTLGWWYGKNRFAWGLTTAICCSAVGVVLLLKPAFHADQWLGTLAGLLSGIISAVAYLQVRRLGRLGEPEYRVVFYFSLICTVAGFLGSMIDKPLSALWQGHTWTGIGLLLGIGLTATTAQIAMTRAYRYGNTLVTANLQYTGIVFSSVWGILIWNNAPNWVSWLGMGIILTSGVIATFYNTQQQPAASPSAITETDPIATEI
jgi:S-adenosylmethionine uptake transporter